MYYYSFKLNVEFYNKLAFGVLISSTITYQCN